jgi:hypothetical protein
LLSNGNADPVFHIILETVAVYGLGTNDVPVVAPQNPNEIHSLIFQHSEHISVHNLPSAD